MVKKTILILSCLYMITISSFSHALNDPLKQTVEIAISASRLQSERIKIASENIANDSTTGSTPGEDPYKRKVVFAKNKYNKRLKTNVVTISKVGFDDSPFILRYSPNHPAADANGYVKYPNIHKEIERADASEAQRGYEANLSVMEMSKSMMQKTIEAIK